MYTRLGIAVVWPQRRGGCESSSTRDCQHFPRESITEAGLLWKKRFGVKFQPNLLSVTHSNAGLSYSRCE